MRQSKNRPLVPMLCVATLTLTMIAVGGDRHRGQDNQDGRRSSLNQRQDRPRRALRRQSRPRRTVEQPAPPVFPAEFRSIDGFGNNRLNPRWGAAGRAFLRMTPVTYGDGVDSPAGADRPNARRISNALCHQDEDTVSSHGATALFWQWGQFLDHDLNETPVAGPREEFDIVVPAGDPWFDPHGVGGVTIPLDRSSYQMINNVRQQINNISAFIDGSMVYGSDEGRAQQLRTMDGTGRLKTDGRNMLPLNTRGLPNAPTADNPFLFLAGDIRANEHIGLTALHTLFVREHNYWADQWALRLRGDAAGEMIYQRARAIVAAEIQAITYREFLPLLIGQDALPTWGGYDANVDAGISNVFATAAFRVGHTMLSTPMLRLDARGNEIPAGHLPLAEAFFNPRETMEHGIDVTIRGLLAQPAQEVDGTMIDDVRNFLFGPPGAGGFDLASLNIQRGRDHGLATYNQVREAFGLTPATTFADISPDHDVQDALAAVYDDVEQLDAWVGMLCEPHVRRAMVGETIRAVLIDQFSRLRSGDRFWYESYLPSHLRAEVERQTLASIIVRNTDVRIASDRNPFLVEGFVPHVEPCPTDVDGNDRVDVQDMLSVLANWGECPAVAACWADTDGNGLVDVQDLLAVLANWGACGGP